MQFALLEAIRNGRYRQAKLLVEADVELNGHNDERGETPLITCCIHLPDAKLRAKFVSLLLDARADPNGQDRHGMTTLMHASVLGQADVVLLLLNHKDTNLEIQDVDGNTALMYAAAFGHPDIVMHLLDQMGRLKQVLHLSLRNNKGLTALQQAENNHHASVTTLLGKEHGVFPLTTDGNGFPELGQLDRNPTPGSPLLTFPMRWQQRRMLEHRLFNHKRQTCTGDNTTPTKDTEDESVKNEQLLQEPHNSEINKCKRISNELAWPIDVDFKNNKLIKPACSLPRLCVKDRKAGVLDIDKHWISSDGFMTRNGRMSLMEKSRCRSPPEERLTVPDSIDSRRSHSEPRDGLSTDRIWSTSSTSSDRFQHVLNILDASIQNDTIVSRNTYNYDNNNNNDDNDGDVELGHSSRRGPNLRGGQETWKTCPTLRAYRFTNKLHSRYFPPIRPIQTTLAHEPKSTTTPPDATKCDTNQSF